ncbi:MAG: molybdenum cofactor guanylyltransferase MobA [Rhodospirillales bacterium]|nr:molybdenum cofactor guanylyltransferase MobA [Rhodospirillales bacterium]
MTAGACPVEIGVLLAGGRSERMGGGDKTLKILGGQPMLARIIARARPQVGELIVNANGDPARFATFGLPVVADVIEGFAGPLAGILSALEWTARNRPRAGWVASFPTDAPFFPADLVARLASAVAREGADLACARTPDGLHPVFGLWRVELRHDLRHALIEENIRKVEYWTSRHKLAYVDYATTPTNPFFNINRPEDLAAAEAALGQSTARSAAG